MEAKLKHQKVAYNLARVGVVSDLIPCGPFCSQQLVEACSDLQLLPECEVECAASGYAASDA